MRIPIVILTLAASTAQADPSVIEDVSATQTGSGWRFDVTLRHPDIGWDHYADGWEVLAPDGTRLGFRELLHPHVTEQPFTRSLAGIEIPVGVTGVMIRARCNIDGWQGEPLALTLTP